MNTMSEQEESIIKIAASIINEEIDIIDGCRLINRMRFNVDEKDDDMYFMFIYVDSESDLFPLKEVRDRFSEEYLEKMDEEMRLFVNQIKDEVYKSCEKIIEFYGLR